jgi:site-specific recombinase XerD
MRTTINEFLKAQIGVTAPATQEWYCKRLAPLLACGTLADVTPAHLRERWASLATQSERWANNPHRPPAPGGLSPYTLDSYYRAWRAFFNWCVDQEYIERNPMTKLKRPPLPAQMPKAISEADLSLMLNAARASLRDYALLNFLTSTGCRIGGLVGLRLGDLEMDRHRAWVVEKGRGGGKRRLVYLHAKTMRALHDFLYTERRWGCTDRVFVTVLGRPLTADGIRSLLRRIAHRASVRGQCNPHAFRHRFVRNLLTNGCDLSVASQLAGHSSVQVTAAFYARWTSDELQERHAQFARLPNDTIAPGDS